LPKQTATNDRAPAGALRLVNPPRNLSTVISLK
jgi:hypothetical protein